MAGRCKGRSSTLAVRRELLVAAGGWELSVSEDMALLVALDQSAHGASIAEPGIARRVHAGQMTQRPEHHDLVAQHRGIVWDRAPVLESVPPESEVRRRTARIRAQAAADPVRRAELDWGRAVVQAARAGLGGGPGRRGPGRDRSGSGVLRVGGGRVDRRRGGAGGAVPCAAGPSP